MDVYVENNVNKIKPTTIRGKLNSMADVGNKRAALRDISANFAGEPALITANRKGGLDKNSFNCNDPRFGGCHRPVTRHFAASRANHPSIYQPPLQILDEKKRPEVTENKKHRKSIPEFSASINTEEHKTDQISPLPSFVKQTEAMIEEMEAMVDDCELEEMEMEDLVEEPIMDIDRSDSNNPLAVTDYIEDIHSFYREAEGLGCVNPDYMSNQFDINDKMRAILIDWLIEVHYKFELMDETLFLMVNLIDRFLAKQKVVRKKLQLVGVTAMLLACKYEEVSVPVVDDLIQISDRAYTREEVLAMEKLMVNILQFNLSIPTSYVFLKRFLKASQADRKLELLSFFMIELCLVEYQMIKFPPSLLAAAAIYTAQCTIKGSRFWTRTAEFYTNYTEDQLLECSRMMVGFHHKAGIGKLTGVHRKFSTHKFGFSARIEPARFLLS